MEQSVTGDYSIVKGITFSLHSFPRSWDPNTPSTIKYILFHPVASQHMCDSLCFLRIQRGEWTGWGTLSSMPPPAISTFPWPLLEGFASLKLTRLWKRETSDRRTSTCLASMSTASFREKAKSTSRKSHITYPPLPLLSFFGFIFCQMFGSHDRHTVRRMRPDKSQPTRKEASHHRTQGCEGVEGRDVLQSRHRNTHTHPKLYSQWSLCRRLLFSHLDEVKHRNVC